MIDLAMTQRMQSFDSERHRCKFSGSFTLSALDLSLHLYINYRKALIENFQI